MACRGRHCPAPEKKYVNPLPAVDIVIFSGGGIVLVKRKNPPYGWALPGGFVESGETLEAAAAREAFEETGLKVTLKEQFHTYSDPERDPRRHTISTVFLAEAKGTPAGADDALEARVFPWSELPAPLCFDHGKILGDVKRYLESGKRPV
ncbi:NUDIX hydrolase [bacterium]|nr:MAG: NUDIX hydrolase [bacterium]